MQSSAYKNSNVYHDLKKCVAYLYIADTFTVDAHNTYRVKTAQPTKVKLYNVCNESFDYFSTFFYIYIYAKTKCCRIQENFFEGWAILVLKYHVSV